ncbi:hypothetical protein DL93DRAFT_2127591 [Clavulina sp. PMI_390]|nr:hypothetical protein DL93DRAFT_2127591 [Clavulina sp. PMI_390]
MPRRSARATLASAVLEFAQDHTGAFLAALVDDGMSTSSSSTSLSSTSKDTSMEDASADALDSPPQADAEPPDSDDDDEELASFRLYALAIFTSAATLEFIQNQRVLFPNPPVPKNSQLLMLLNDFSANHSVRFRANLRMEPTTFDHILSLINDDPVFQNNSNITQIDPRYQLAIALYRFGHYGNAASVQQVAQWAGCSEGLVVLSTYRVMTALLRLSEHAMASPTDAEIARSKAFVAKASCAAWRDGYCMVDGTLIPLAFKPGWFGPVFFDRKSNYSLNVQIVNLANYLIIDFVVGPCGSVHDASAFTHSAVHQDPNTFFRQGEWVWADSAYALLSWCAHQIRALYGLPEGPVGIASWSFN